MTPNVQQVPARQLDAGDRIGAAFLGGDPAGEVEVLFTHTYQAGRRSWAFVVLLLDGTPEAEYWLADAMVPVTSVADPDYGRTTAVAEARPDTLVQALGRAAQGR